MLKKLLVLTFLLLLPLFAAAEQTFEKDTITTTAGDVEITFIGHASLMLTYKGKTIHIDPFSKLADYTQLPKADLILLTHEHRDHLDEAAIAAIKTDATQFVVNSTCAEKLNMPSFLKNGDSTTALEIPIAAVPAYNIVHKRDNGVAYHPQGIGNGYILTFGTTKIYVAGDTENIPEMKALTGIDIAFLPMNIPYTMTPEMVADAAKAFKPKVLYPYHFGTTDTALLTNLMADTKDVEIRIRKMP